MSRIAFILVVLVFAFTSTYVLAKNEGFGSGNASSEHGNSGVKQEEHVEKNEIEDSHDQTEVESPKPNTSSTVLPSNKGPKRVSTSSATPNASCDPALEWKNHGEYVKCVARLHPGGEAVSLAAKSDIGKKGGKEGSESGHFSPSPVASSSANPSPEASESATPSATINPSPEESTESGVVSQAVTTILNQIQGLFDQLKSLFSF